MGYVICCIFWTHWGDLDVPDLPVPVYIPAYLGCVYYQTETAVDYRIFSSQLKYVCPFLMLFRSTRSIDNPCLSPPARLCVQMCVFG